MKNLLPLLLVLCFPQVLAADVSDKLHQYQKQRSPERVYLHLDKPLYEPGDTIWYQAYVRNESDLKPANKSQILHVELIDPKGNVAQTRRLIVKDGTSSGDFPLDADLQGGLYRIKAYTQWQKNDSRALLFERDIPVQQVILPKLKMKLVFLRQAYGPGDTVKAKLNLETLSNTPLAGKDLEFVLSLGGKQIKRFRGKSDKKGQAILRLDLPKDLNTSDGLLNVLINHEGQTESISRAIPISLNKIALEILPEGGDLVYGLKSRVAFRAVNEFGKPADISGKLINAKGKILARFDSFHNGMGGFDLLPKKGQSYFVQITRPRGIENKYPVPEALNKGFILSTKQKRGNLMVKIAGNVKERMLLLAQVRGKVYFKKHTRGGRLNIPLNKFPMGVIQLTLFDSNNIERAERLVFNYSNKTLKIKISSDKKKYLPREKVKLRISATDHRGVPVPANLSLAVTDDKLISYADDKNGHILAKLLLEPDLKSSVYKPNFYFDKKEKKARRAMDYLMLTQGWRRFVWQEILEAKPFTPSHPAESTILKGRVMDGNKPAANATVNVVGSKKRYVTNKDGEFTIADLELYKVQSLQAQKGKRKGVPVQVNDYNQFVTLYLHHFRVLGRAAVPQAAMPAEVMENEVAAPKRKMLKKAKPKKDKTKAAEKKRQVKQPRKEMAEADAAKMERAREPVAQGIMEDKAMLNMRFAPRQQQQALQPKYHRAREFPKVIYQTTKTKVRQDFRSTIYWQGQIKLDRRGRANIEFYNSDEVTAFRTVLEGVSKHGLVGRAESLHYTQLPFSMNLRLPRQLVSGDMFQLPLKLANRGNSSIKGRLQFELPKALEPVKSLPTQIKLQANSSRSLYLPFRIGNAIGDHNIKIMFHSEVDEDAFERPIKIVAKGFPINLAFTGQELEKEISIETRQVISGSLQAKLTVYPSNMSNLLAGIESILREPYGCFEQTSSSTYPNIMIMDYLGNTDFDKPEVITRAKNLIQKGYKRLVSFETKQKGYEWFGQAPGHEALTAYGLMEFKDMSRVFAGVDDTMIKRTAKWILSRRDGKGGFLKNKKALDSFGRANDDITNAYIVYALSEAGYVVEIRKELDAAVSRARNNKDPYQLALVSNALFNTKDKRAPQLLKLLNGTQQQNGAWQGLSHSITRSTGKALEIETTALAILANLKAKAIDGKRVKIGIEYIVSARSPGGGFGNTQSTVMALRALTVYAKYAKRTAEPGTIAIYLADREIARQSYEAGRQEPIILDNLEKHMQSGKQVFKVKYIGVKNPLPYSLNVDYNSNLPPSSNQANILLETSISKGKLRMGETTRLNIKMRNQSKEGQAMNLAIVGIPAGLSPQLWQLKDLQKKHLVDFYEVTGNEVVFYYRQMKPQEQRNIQLDLKADIPGVYQGAAARSYLYYTNEHKHWVPGLQVEINR